MMELPKNETDVESTSSPRPVEQLDDLVAVAETFSFGRRRQALGDGEAAIVADPDQSPLWSVNHYDPELYSGPERFGRMLKAARYVIGRAWEQSESVAPTETAESAVSADD